MKVQAFDFASQLHASCATARKSFSILLISCVCCSLVTFPSNLCQSNDVWMVNLQFLLGPVRPHLFLDTTSFIARHRCNLWLSSIILEWRRFGMDSDLTRRHTPGLEHKSALPGSPLHRRSVQKKQVRRNVLLLLCIFRVRGYKSHRWHRFAVPFTSFCSFGPPYFFREFPQRWGFHEKGRYFSLVYSVHTLPNFQPLRFYRCVCGRYHSTGSDAWISLHFRTA